MKFLPLATSGTIISTYNFWNAVLLYHDRPQVVNRKIIGVSQSFIYRIEFHSTSVKIKDLLTHAGLLYEVRKITELNQSNSFNLIKGILEPYDKTVIITEVTEEFLKQNSEDIFISARKLLPKQSNNFCIELVLFDKDNNLVTFLAAEDGKNISAPPFPYHVEIMSTGHVRLLVDNFEDAETSSAEWLVDKLFLKLIKWAEEYSSEAITDPSLKLVDIEEYSQLYKNLKDKYGQKMVLIWPENTDPLKFVYEDLAIAAYLICLWNKYSITQKPSFVDLGCGNGLLVYILNEEGYPGYGIDVRKRKIWDIYPKNVNLEVKTITPSDKHLFPNTDWIIGNHSDELTPWIPVIAARSSSNTNFFLLPCCSYEFSGKKYSRKDTSKSQYGEYLDYVQQISTECGFKTERDKLRIPSTKKICIVAFERTYKPEEFNIIDANITKLINQQGASKNGHENWIENFEPRAKVEIVRNCTKLERSLISKIISIVVTELLRNENFISRQDQDNWNSGGTIALPKLIEKIHTDDLKLLKNECGGLQTLLRNHRYIFEVVKGKVSLRKPPKLEEIQKFKEKPCWFHFNHPDRCLHDSATCAYSHSSCTV